MTMTAVRKTTIIIPVFNEEDGIEQLRVSLHELRQALYGELEFVFVDDGSRDKTSARLREEFSSDPNCKIVVHAVNRGIGAAFRTGFENATGEIICTIDADCSYRPEGLKRLIEALDETGAQIAVASPYHPKGGVEGVPPWRLMLSRACSMLYRLLAPVRLYTYTSVFRAYTRDVIRNVRFQSNGFVSAVEILFSAARRGYRITEVPMVLHARVVGQSKMKIARTIRTHLQLMWDLLVATTGIRSGNGNEKTVVTSSPAVVKEDR
jgi:dolichol-phosphate mannosyltransferase